MTRHDPPPELVALADARAAARRARDWATADDLKARIEDAGWKVVDTGTLYDLVLAVPPDITEGDVTRYGASRSVPSRLAEAPVGTASVVAVLDDDPSVVAGLVRGLAGHAPDGTQLVLVADGLGSDHAEVLEALDAADPGAPGVVVEVVRTARRLGAAAARNAGVRRATGPVVLFADPRLVPTGDVVSPLVATLADPAVAVAGPFGLVSPDLRHFEPAPPGDGPVDAVDLAMLAFRRADYLERGPLDEGFESPASLDAWWSLVLRDVGDEAGADAEPRLALQVTGVPVERPAPPAGPEDAPSGEPGVGGGDAAGRAARRNRYRFLKRFASRRDLLTRPGRQSAGTEGEIRRDRP